MLHIKYNEDGKVVYAFDKASPRSDCELTDCVVVAHKTTIHNTVRSRKKIEDWHHANQHHINDISIIFLEALKEFCEINPQYVCSVKESDFHSNMIQTLYLCSHNAFKNYPSL